MNTEFSYPLDSTRLLRKKKQIRRHLLESEGHFSEIRIAILGGSTTAEIKDMIELFLLNNRVRPVFYQSSYNRYFEEAVFKNDALLKFKPDVVYIHTSAANLNIYPEPTDSESVVDNLCESVINKFNAIWDGIGSAYGCPVIQNNFELPSSRLSGNYSCYAIQGSSRYISLLNERFSREARVRSGLYINDINYLSAWFGLERWYDKVAWYSYKYAMSIDAMPLLAESVASIICAIRGRSRKCLIVDLDNTLWGGVIGDDGVNNIRIGEGAQLSEAYSDVQRYIKSLKARGIVLAVSSKNEESTAREGFAHEASILSVGDFSAFKANWLPKSENIEAIARELNLGLDSIVFLDDNPVERDLVRKSLPIVAVPEIGSNVTSYIAALDKPGYFETISMSAEDSKRSDYYFGNQQRVAQQNSFSNYDDFLISLEMAANIREIGDESLDRVTQLINKTNQFNLTTKRVTRGELEIAIHSPSIVAICGQLKDRFGDNGLVSAIIGDIRGTAIHLNVWIMSCRVLKRGMEHAMFDRFVSYAMSKGVEEIIGYYVRTNKNVMVSTLFNELGFERLVESSEVEEIWSLKLEGQWMNRNTLIRVIA